MSWWKYLRRAQRDADARRELQSYIDIETDENIARGMRPDAARAAAHRKLGNMTRVREEIYFMNTIRPLDAIRQDLRYSARLLVRDRRVAIAAVLSLALGIGANTAIFQLLDAIRLRSLPVERPEELVEVRLAPGQSRTGMANGRRPMFSYAQLEELRRHQQAFDGWAVWSSSGFNTAPGGEVQIVEGLFVSGDFFRTLGVTPTVGRLLAPDDDRRGCSPAAVISHAYWQRAYGGDPDVLRQTLLLNGVSFPIVGITPASFFGVEVGRRFDVAVPLCADALLGDADRLDRRDVWWLGAIGRLRDGWTADAASAHVQQLAPAIFAATVPVTYQPDDTSNYLKLRLMATPASAGISGLRTTFGEALVLLLGITALVLVVACANLANLLLARAAAREREIAAHMALGASRARVFRQLVVESALLAAIGALAGAWLGHLLSQSLVSMLAGNDSALFVDLAWNWRLFAFTAGVATLACMLFGVAPALRATAVSPAETLRAGGRGLTTSRERFALRRALVVSQVSLSLVLIVGGVLFSRTLYNLLTADIGFRADGLLIATLSQLPGTPGAEAAHARRRELIERLAQLPQVAEVAEAAVAPLSQISFWNESVRLDGHADQAPVLANFNSVGPGFLRMTGVRLLAGRDFSERDTLRSTPVAIVSESFARTMMPDGNVLGRTIRLEAAPGEPEPTYEIIGVAADTKYGALREQPSPLVFLNAAQDRDPGSIARLILRPADSFETLTPAVIAAVRNVDPGIYIQFLVWDEAIRDSMVRERLMAGLSAAFGLLAVVLAAVGLYGLMSYTVARRTQEIGLRLAIGASNGNVLRLLLGEAATLVGLGVVAGGVLAAVAARSTASLLYGLEPLDPVTFGAASVGLLLVGLLAGFIPARRATSLDPTMALRAE